VPPKKLSRGELGAEVREAVQRLEGKPRNVSLQDIEVRAKDGEGWEFNGVAAVFDQLSEDLGGFREIIKRGAFKPVLEDDVRFLINHNEDLVLARSTSGTLAIEEKPRGLTVESDVAPVSYGDDIRVLLERGDVDQMSFAFRVAEDSWFEDEEGNLLRTIHKFERLFDVSIVTYPAYPQTEAGLRAIRKLDRGEVITDEERAAVEALLENSTQPDSSEQESRADGEEPETSEADESASRAEVESEETPDGLSARSARLRLRERIARL
jgi:HK97 family phage prohead protease